MNFIKWAVIWNLPFSGGRGEERATEKKQAEKKKWQSYKLFMVNTTASPGSPTKAVCSTLMNEVRQLFNAKVNMRDAQCVS